MGPITETRHRGGLVPLYRALWRHARGSRGLVCLFTLLLMGSQAVRLVIPYLSGEAVDAMQRDGLADPRRAALDMALIFLACIASWAMHGPGRVVERYVALTIRERFADTVYARVAARPMAWHESHHSGDTIHRLEKATAALWNFSQSQFIYLQNLVNLLGPIVALFVISALTGGAALAGYLVIALLLVRYDRIMLRLNRQENRAERRYTAALVDCLGNIATVIALRLEAATRQVVGAKLKAVGQPLRRNIVMNEAKWCVTDLLNNAIRCGLPVLYVWLAYRQTGAVMLGTAVMVYQYAQQAGGVVSSMAGNYQDLVRYQVDFASTDGILAPPHPGPAEARQAPAPPPDWREIRLEGLRFTYGGDGTARPTLDRIGLTLRRGGRVALVGESGCGKSTLLRLLAGLYPADAARYAVDGMARPELRHLGAVATLVPQDPEIFESSLGRNLTLGVSYPEVELRRACAVAGLTPVIERLPAGLDTPVAERGINLSGGQKQRLALARGILAGAGSSLLLLDEPTSSVDAETEARIYDALLAGFGQACIVSSIHRLHLLTRFEHIVLMAEGRIVDSGTLAELAARQPAFRALWQDYGGRPAACPADGTLAA